MVQFKGAQTRGSSPHTALKLRCRRQQNVNLIQLSRINNNLGKLCASLFSSSDVVKNDESAEHRDDAVVKNDDELENRDRDFDNQIQVTEETEEVFLSSSSSNND